MRISDWSSDVCSSDLMTLVRNLANIVSTSEEFAPSRDDKAEVMDRMVKEAEQAIEAGQAWLDKARPIGRIADDVVRLAGIIVAGTDLHASLSEAMDQHIRSEEHTSELQSLMRISYAVFCLKKKKQRDKRKLRHRHNKEGIDWIKAAERIQKKV